MKKNEKFSLRARLRSFTYALNGIADFLKQEHNALIHLLATAVVIALAFIFPLSGTEIILLAIVIGLVWITELVNTAIEKIVDFISVERKPEIKFIKDLAAAAVLLAAVVAVVTGCIIFIPKV
ncbi:MAG: diacylglycerol kinase family protein [Chitinophagaceae bacterium]